MFTYTYLLSAFPNNKVSSDRLTQEINSSSIVIALDRIDTNAASVNIVFKMNISDEEKIVLDNIVANHSGEPLVRIEVQKVEILTEHAKYVESGNATQELYMAESIIMDVSADESIKTQDISWPFDIGLKNGTLFITPEMVGDEITVVSAPNTLVGALTRNMNVGDTSIYVSDSVLQNIKKGFWVNLYSQDKEIGLVARLETDRLVLAAPSDASAYAGSLVSMTPKIIKYVCFSSEGKIEFGKTIPTAQRIPAGVIARIIYKNNNNQAKKVHCFIEYLY